MEVKKIANCCDAMMAEKEDKQSLIRLDIAKFCPFCGTKISKVDVGTMSLSLFSARLGLNMPHICICVKTYMWATIHRGRAKPWDD